MLENTHLGLLIFFAHFNVYFLTELVGNFFGECDTLILLRWTPKYINETNFKKASEKLNLERCY